MEFALGGLAACGACFFSNPLEVVKTRMQLQGELHSRGTFAKGLAPALWYQLLMNGIRLGTYQTFINLGLTKTSSGEISVPRSILAGAVAGSVGAFVGSPMYLVKTHLQAESAQKIAVGYQHHHRSMTSALISVYRQYSIPGLWRGVTAAIPRVMVGSATQLSSFSKSKHLIEGLELFEKGSWLNTLLASMTGGAVVVFFMTPFDVVSTRLYNQGLDSKGRGLNYSGFFDCIGKILLKEGPLAFYKGWTASLFRLGPHTILTLVFWSELRKVYVQLQPGNPA